MLDFLAAGNKTAGEIANRFEISRPAVARHLRILEKNDLIVITQKSRSRVHRLNAEPLLTVFNWLKSYERFWDDNLMRLKQLVEASALADKEKDT